MSSAYRARAVCAAATTPPSLSARLHRAIASNAAMASAAARASRHLAIQRGSAVSLASRAHVGGVEVQRRRCGASAQQAKATSIDLAALREAVRAAETLARSLRDGRSVKEVALDANTASSAALLTKRLPSLRRVSALETSASEGATLVVRAVAAFARARFLHGPGLEALAALPGDLWRSIPGPVLVNAVYTYAWLQLEDAEMLETLANALTSTTLQRLTPMQVIDLAWATASFGTEAPRSLRDRSLRVASSLQPTESCAKLPQLSKLAWSLAKLSGEEPRLRSVKSPPNGMRNSSLRNVAVAACELQDLQGGPHFAKLLWAFAHVRDASTLKVLRKRARPGRSGLGRDAFALLLRDAPSHFEEVALLRALAKHGAPDGLRAAVLNAAASRALTANDEELARDVLQEMAQASLWTRVTCLLAARLDKRRPPVEGKPPYPGLTDPGPKAHKYVRAAYHALNAAGEPGDGRAVAAGLEDYSRRRGWLKFGAADEKGKVIDAVLREVRKTGEEAGARELVALEFGTFLGYSTLRLLRGLGPRARVVTLESDPEVACLAMNLLHYAGEGQRVDVVIGDSEDLVPALPKRLPRGSVQLVYMDHNQITYHQDLARLEASGVLAPGARLVVTQVLKPGAPLLLWRLLEAQRAGRLHFEVVSAPDCGFKLMEDWVVIATFQPAVLGDRRTSAQPYPVRVPPRALALLAAECNLMRWRTAQGLVDEKGWNGFVQHVRRRLEALLDLESALQRGSSSAAWPSEAQFAEARRQRLQRRFDF